MNEESLCGRLTDLSDASRTNEELRIVGEERRQSASATRAGRELAPPHTHTGPIESEPREPSSATEPLAAELPPIRARRVSLEDARKRAHETADLAEAARQQSLAEEARHGVDWNTSE